MALFTVNLTKTQIEELVQNVEPDDYVEYVLMADFNDYMAGIPALDILADVDHDNFDQFDEYAVKDGHGFWVSADSLAEIFEPYLDEMLQDYLDNTLG